MLKIRSEQFEIFKQSFGDDDAIIVSVLESPDTAKQNHEIRDEQLDAISGALFHSRVMQVLKQVYPDYPPDDAPQFHDTLQKVLAKGKQYRILEDRELARFVSLAYLFGDDFDTEFSAAQSVLIDDSRPADERLQLLEFWAEQMLGAVRT